MSCELSAECEKSLSMPLISPMLRIQKLIAQLPFMPYRTLLRVTELLCKRQCLEQLLGVTEQLPLFANQLEGISPFGRTIWHASSSLSSSFLADRQSKLMSSSQRLPKWPNETATLAKIRRYRVALESKDASQVICCKADIACKPCIVSQQGVQV